MEIKRLVFPGEDDGYLKKIIEKSEKGVAMQCGSVTLTKGQLLPFKRLDFHEVSYLISGKLKVSTKDGNEKLMNKGDLIYLNKEEIRKTETLEDSKILFFLFNDI
ncbi:hypothetical protein GTQ34_10685 [Muricauda sp. JGD-17]|uniref:(S)-ureidoglycine aminohydrolase cupin domain-containing protein n=1 Tax=Flagellimonas ochracea TaxID=2696472 RepID=A0A964TF27_9FLAO|nr:cupin domain-containing protein [Allomuricauda ochracea]NAY92386.1 hypothetical protein [Allomuricauda ochracea]